MVGGKNKIRCDKCKKIIRKHIFNRFNKILCGDCYSIEFQKELYSGKYFTFYKGSDKE
jgi:phage FluMu protein Com